MQRLAELVVRRRVPILAAAIVLAVVSALLIPQVNIEKDLTRYLPASSDTRQGLDVMAEEFGETCPVRVMYSDAGLTDSSRAVIASDLEGLPFVSSVSSEVGEAGTSGEGKTLFTVLLEGGLYSDSASQGLAAVRAYAEGTGAVVAGGVVDVADQQASLGFTFALALAVLLVILVVMCPSWVEPALFLLTIGIAVLLNLGTCAFLPSVSETTFSIAAVLQLALSMDYSIMLTDRYRQERAAEPDPARAMVSALRGGFAAIASSSLTTVAGMLCLVAMSFAIGRDLGVVLAKGVAFSLLAVLFVLPGLMVSCDGAVRRTRKPAPRPRMAGAARASYRGRYAILGCFAVLAVLSFAAKGTAAVGFFTETSSPDAAAIDAAFPPEQEMALLYSRDMPDAAGALEQVASLEGVDGVQAYETTLAKPLGASDMADELGLDESLVQALYYLRFVGEPVSSMTVRDFAALVEGLAADAGPFAGLVDDASAAQAARLAVLSDPEAVLEERTAAETAEALGIGLEAAEQLCAGYFMATVTGVDEQLTVPAFVSFVQEGVLGSPLFSDALDDEARAGLERLAGLADVAAVTAPLGPDEMAQALGLDADLVRQAYLYQASLSWDPAGYTLTAPRFLAALSDVLASSASGADAGGANAGGTDAAAGVERLRAIADASAAGTLMTPEAMAQALGLDASSVEGMYILYGAVQEGGPAPATLTLPRLLDFLAAFASSDQAPLYLDADALAALQAQAAQLAQAQAAADLSVTGASLDAAGMAQALGLDPAAAALAFAASAAADGTLAMPQMSVQEFLAFLVTTAAASPQFSGQLDESQLAQLYQARLVVDMSVSGTALDANGLAEVLGMDPAQVTALIVLRQYLAGGVDEWTCDLASLLAYAAGSLEGAEGAEEDEDARAAQLAALNQIVQGSLSQTSYTASEMAGLLGRAAGGEAALDASSVGLAYMLQESRTLSDPSWALSVEQLVAFAAEQLGEGGALASSSSAAGAASELDQARGQLELAKGQLVGQAFERAVVTTSYGRDSDEMARLVGQVRGVMDATGAAYHLVGDGPMGVEMSELFDRDFNAITLLTAGTVFLIVAATFRSLLMPLVLTLLIQTAVNLTMWIAALEGSPVYYIALMVVQALLMGATIDYAILFTTCYREAREQAGPREAVARAFPASIGTILTSGSILVLVLLVVGLATSDVTTSEVCLTLSRGALIAVLLVLLFLPGMLCALDRVVAGPRAYRPDPSRETSFGGAAGIALAEGAPYAPDASVPAGAPDGGRADAAGEDEGADRDESASRGAHWAPAPSGRAAAEAAPGRHRAAAADEEGSPGLAWPELSDLAVTPPGKGRRPGGDGGAGA